MQDQKQIAVAVEAPSTAVEPADRTRRRLLQVGAALAAGAMATTVMNREDARAAGVLNGQSNSNVAAVSGYNSANGPGVWGHTIQGKGVWGTADQNDGDGVVGYAGETGRGVAGHSVDGIGVEAYSETSNAIVATADDATAIVASSPNWTAIRGTSGIENGVHGVSTSGVGVRGDSQGNAGVRGDSNTGNGVHGESWDGVGVYGKSVDGFGVRGLGATAPGISGHSTGGIGIVGTSDADAGIRGYSDKAGVQGVSPTGIGIQGYSVDGVGTVGHTFYGVGLQAKAEDDTAVALQVQGRSQFQTAGNAVFPDNTPSLFVSEPLTSLHSHVSVMFMEDPAPNGNPPPAISWVQRTPDIGFRVHLTATLDQPTAISYLVVEPVLYQIHGDSTDPNDRG